MNIAVFGGLGFIGQNVVKSLLDEHNVYIFDNALNPSRLSTDFEYFHGDARNTNDVDDFFKRQSIDIVLNLIANADISVSSINRFIDFDLSPLVNLNLLLASEKYNISRYLYFSGSGVYGDPKSLTPVAENLVTVDCASLYGASKMACESFCLAFSNTGKLSVGILRPGNILGPGATHGLIYDIMLKIKKDKSKIEVLGNGTQEKSYIHVSDVIEGVKVLISSTNKKDIYNIASDDTITVKVIIDEIIKQTGFSTKVNYGIENIGWVGDVPRCKLDCTWLKNSGWSPKYNSLEAVKKAVCENLDLLI